MYYTTPNQEEGEELLDEFRKISISKFKSKSFLNTRNLVEIKRHMWAYTKLKLTNFHQFIYVLFVCVYVCVCERETRWWYSSLAKFHVTSMTGALILINLWVWLSHPWWKMTNINTIKCRSQIKDLTVMINRCSFSSQHGELMGSCECWLFLF